MRQLEPRRQRDFGMGKIRFIHGRDIWLALDDNHCDSRRYHRYSRHHPQTEPVGSQELMLFHRQLFYWLLIRSGPCVFPVDLQLQEGVPAGLRADN